MQKSLEENTFRPGLRLELPYLMDALAGDALFLRDAKQLRLLTDITADHHRHGEDPFHSFLAVGCDRGMDAYSLCIALLEESRRNPGMIFSILATEFLPENMQHATRGIYPSTAVRELPQDLVSRYFLRSRKPGDSRVRLRPGVRGLVHFRCQDIFDSFALREPMDVILCRHILHHFHPDLAAAMAGRLREYLSPGGILVLGERIRKATGFRHLGHALYQAV